MNRLRSYRWKELGLLVIPFMVLLLELTQLLLVPFLKQDPAAAFSLKNLPTAQALIPVLGLIIVLLGTNILFSFFFPKADQALLPLVGLLSGIGILMATRLGPNVGVLTLGTKQLTWVLVGLIACIGTLFGLRSMNWLRRYKYSWAVLGIILVGVTIANALRVKNLDSPTHDQLSIGLFQFQPSELLKICIVIFFAAYISENREMFAGRSLRFLRFLRLPPLRILGPFFSMLGIALLLFLVVRELGLALLIYGLFLTMLYLGSSKISYIIGGLFVFLLLGFIGYSIFSYVRARFTILGIDLVTPGSFNEDLYQGTGIYQGQNGAFQVVQGLIALASGGIIGSGLGLGHPGFVPVVQSDLIFTALGEEFGLAGLFAIIGLYLLIIYRGFRIAIESGDAFNQLLAAGLTSIFAIQTVIIVAGNMKFFPLTGIPLPFLSYGGSSVIANYIIIGILLRISHNTAREREGLA